MREKVKLVSIPEERFPDYRYDVIFNAYKWDPQMEDHDTISKHVAVMPPETARELAALAEKLALETTLMEEALAKEPKPAKELSLPRPVYKSLEKLQGYDSGRHVRLMRFDFHPTEDGWAVSEVNSDVPGGLAESSVLPELAAAYVEGFKPCGSTAGSLLNAFRPKIREGGRIAFIHATSYSDDRQVMQFLSDYFRKNGYETLLAAPDHIRWRDGRAHSIIEGGFGELDAIVRFFPLEWLVNLPGKPVWKGFYDCLTPSCNHPIAIFAQSKRLPLVWDCLDTDVPVWKGLLPETVDPGKIKSPGSGWIYKPALGRVGEGISIKEALSQKELQKIQKAVRRFPKSWIAQRRFKSLPLETEDGESYHLCLGVFTVDGKFAGFYGRISAAPLIDAKAKDIPVLVSREEKGDER